MPCCIDERSFTLAVIRPVGFEAFHENGTLALLSVMVSTFAKGTLPQPMIKSLTWFAQFVLSLLSWRQRNFGTRKSWSLLSEDPKIMFNMLDLLSQKIAAMCPQWIPQVDVLGKWRPSRGSGLFFRIAERDLNCAAAKTSSNAPTQLAPKCTKQHDSRGAEREPGKSLLRIWCMSFIICCKFSAIVKSIGVQLEISHL